MLRLVVTLIGIGLWLLPMKQFLTLGFVALLILPSVAPAQQDFGVLDIPQPESVQSGIGLLSGWKCEATSLTVRFDGGPEIAVAYGSSRQDTRVPCGDTNNGFGLPWNYNLLSEGRHQVEVFDDGHPFASATFTVTTLGTAFLSGLEGRCTIEDFPFAGEQVALEWQQANQNFVIAAWEGECRDETECRSDEFCRKAVGDCNGQGRCQPRPVICGADLAPVCGCDGQTYGNGACIALNIAHTGTCDGEPYEGPQR